MARSKAQLLASARLADYLTVGYLAMRCPVGTVRDALALHDAQSQRQRGLPLNRGLFTLLISVL